MMTTTSSRQEQRALKAKKKEAKRASKEESKRGVAMEEDDLESAEQNDDIDEEIASSSSFSTTSPSSLSTSSSLSSSSSSHVSISAASFSTALQQSDAMESTSTASSSSSALASAASAIASMPAVSASSASVGVSYMKVSVPPHRYSPLRSHWLELYEPIVQHMKLQIRFNTKRRAVELRTSKLTTESTALNKAADFIRAFILGFTVKDAIALLRLDDLYIDTFEIKDVKTLSGEHLSRAIGRVAGISGKTKFTIENATKTRIVLADTHIHILGSFENINQAKSAIVRLILGSPPGKVYTAMRAIANRAKERF